MNNLAKVRERVIEAVPDLGHKVKGEPERFVPFIRLADVLLAMDKWYWKNEMAHQEGWNWYVAGTVERWNLSDNNLDNQSPEVIQFLADIL